VRQQYYFRQSARGLLAWDVHRLVALTEKLPRRDVPLTHIRELDQPWFGDDEPPTWRSLVSHLELIEAADLSYPIILSADGSVMDGMHRVARALHEGRPSIKAVQLTVDPEPDYIDRRPDELPY
jgi:hypothetical protein